MAQSLRSFFALRPDEEGLDFLSNRIQLFRGVGWERFGRFIPSDDLHLTLRFLGNLEEDVAEKIRAGAAEIAKQTHPFPFEIDRCILFPRVSRARIIAAKVSPSPELKQLARDLEELAVSCGLEPEERPFRPHITLARLKQANKRPNLPSRPGTKGQVAETFSLLESGNGPEDTVSYAETESYTLGATGFDVLG